MKKNKFEKINLPKKLSFISRQNKKTVFSDYNAKYILSIDKKLKNEILSYLIKTYLNELEKLSHSKYFIRSLVALHENCNVSTLDKLAEDKEFFKDIWFLVT